MLTNKLYFFCLMLFVACSSKSPEVPDKNNEYIELSDSIANVIQKYAMSGDTIELRKALALSEMILRHDTIAEHRYKTCYLRSSIYELLGEQDKAFIEQECAVSFLSPEHIDRLTFYGQKMECNGMPDSAIWYYNHALEACESELVANYDNNLFAKKLQLLLYLGRRNEAQDCMKEMMKEHRDDIFLQTLNDELLIITSSP
jgi:tetratricopeptide (TPR) repeat protein